MENTGLGGVTVKLSGMADAQTATDNTGQFAFTGLRAGTYSVEISGFDMDEVGFGSTSSAATIGVGESQILTFDGTYLRTAGIMGQVSAEGEGLAGVTVTMTGEGEDMTDVTDAGGLYAFSKLKAGDYSVAISGYDTDDYEFATTSASVTVATGETANIPFEGTLLRTSGISGRVSVEGTGLDGVEVGLAGAAEATTMTSNGGQYSFAGLAEGTYVLTMMNPDANAYTFEETTATVVLGDSESNITNFEGTHTRTASISGVLFIDEVDKDKMHTEGEPSIIEALGPWLAIQDDETKAMVAGLLTQAKVIVRGPSLNDPPTEVPINPLDGTFTTGETLMKGSYQVELPVNDDMIAAALEAVGVKFTGGSMVVDVDAGGEATHNFPFEITMQTVATGARMGGGGHFGLPVEGVKLALYARADGTGMLDEAETNEMGMATFNFARADDTSPGSEDGDNIVFVRVVESGHPALVVSGNEFVEIDYASTARLYAADHEMEVATLINVAVAFDFWVKSNETARDGDEGLAGWSTAVVMVDSEDPTMTSDPLMKPDPDDDMEMVNATEPTDDGEDNMDDLGKSTFSYVITDPTMLPVTFAVAAVPVMEVAGNRVSVQPDMGEMWEQGDPLTYTHTGLELPPGEDDDMLDLGPIRVTFTTQAIYVGVHRELDDRTGFTDFIGLGDGDSRPTGTAEDEIEVSLMVADSRGRLRTFEYDHDMDDETDDIEATATFDGSGIVSFARIPSDTEVTVVVDAPNDMVIVPDDRATREIDAFGEQLDDYPDGLIVGAYGDGSGARPDVWLCPLARQEDDDPNEVCSTFAYKWATGTVSGSISGLREDDEAMVTLTAVNSNEDYEDDLADDIEVEYDEGGTTYSFTGVADGRYMVTLAANPGSWEEDEATGVSIMHDEDNDDTDYTGDVDSGNGLSATDLRGTIRGVIGNNSNGRNGLTGSESRAGVVVNLHEANAAITSGANRGRRTAKSAVVATAETDDDGAFMFEALQVGKYYFLKPESTDLYTAVRNGSTSIANEMSDDVVPHALTRAIVPDEDYEPNDALSWDAHTSTLNGEGANDFALLYTDGEVEGEVSDPSVRAAHERSVVELHLCKATNQVLDNTADPPTVTTAASQCDEYTGDVHEASVGSDGEWIADGLREGFYEVVVDLPAGYINVSATGTETEADDGFVSQQLVELSGGRADASTETFHIKDRNAGNLAELTSVEIDGTTCTTGTAASNTDNQCGNNDLDDATISVVATASTGATVRLSSSGTDPSPTTTGSYSFGVRNGRASTVTLPEDAGTSRFFVHVASEDGYTTNAAADAGFNYRRDTDTRMDMLTISWGGDRIDLDRRDLGLDPGNPDGETAPVTGTTTLNVLIDEGDNGADVPASPLTIEVVGKNTDFDFVRFAADELTDAPANSGTFGDCPATIDTETGTVTVEANAAAAAGGKGEAAICFRITDSDGDATDVDANTNNMNTYRLILTRR
ncbi:MAG: carboxypeptidase-like regulatory domain-containing protein [Gemmatimonadetes bacterium]|nr:carboxypeptidase-like regulatory domain-containing protein [Gemmatimonadota bacterium]